MEKEKDYKKFAELMVSMAIAIDKDTSIERVEMYFRFLKDLKIETLEKAFYHIIKTEKFPVFPTIGKIRWLIEGDEDEIIEAEANEAWGEACQLVWDLGDTNEPSENHILDESVRVAFGSWKHFGETNPQYEGSDRRHFINCYKGVAKRDKFRLQPAQLRKELMENREKLNEIKKEKA